jgi:hypothetical protein
MFDTITFDASAATDAHAAALAQRYFDASFAISPCLSFLLCLFHIIRSAFGCPSNFCCLVSSVGDFSFAEPQAKATGAAQASSGDDLLDLLDSAA